MDALLAAVIPELVKIGPGALPWVCVLGLAISFVMVVRYFLKEARATNLTMVELIRDSAKADREQAVEYRRLADVVTLRGRSE